MKPSKTEIGFPSIVFLGHEVGNGLLKPTQDNIKKFLDIDTPKTKKTS